MARSSRNRPAPPPEVENEQEEEAPDDFEASLTALNDPDVAHLGEAPSIGGRARTAEDLFGQEADYASGRSTSPKLYAQAAQFPTCVQLRIWKWENGIPVGLGTIDSTATEEEFVRQFYTAMPRRGEGRAQFKFRPIDIRGQELGQEVTVVISEHHQALRLQREMMEEERETRNSPATPFIMPPSDNGAAETTRLVEHMLATAEQRARALEQSLEMEREQIRQEELRRTQERVDLATQAATGVQSIAERMMKDEQIRAERASKMQADQSQLLVTTLTTIFSQQQMQQAAATEAARRADEYRLEQERQRAERERKEAEERRKLDQQEWELRRQRERDEAEFRLRVEREEAERKRKEAASLIEAAKTEMQMRLTAEKEEAERRRQTELERLRFEREEAQRKFEQQKFEMETRVRLEREEIERRAQQAREETVLAKAEMELRLAREREEMERRDRREKDEAERRERWFAEERARREARESQEARERDTERARQHERMIKELEAQAQKDREHAERMAELAKMDRNGSTDVLMSAATMLGKFGLQPNEILPRLFGVKTEDDDGDEKSSSSGWMEALPKIVSVLGDVAKAATSQQPQQVAQQQQPAGMLPPPPPQFQAPPQRERERVAARPMPQQQAQQPAPQPEPTVEAPPAAPPPPSLADIALAKGVPLKAQRNARIAIRGLVKALTPVPDTEWEGKIAAAISQEVAIYHYVQAVSVRAALTEGAATPEVIERVVEIMKASPLVPKDFNYGEPQSSSEEGGQ